MCGIAHYHTENAVMFGDKLKVCCANQLCAIERFTQGFLMTSDLSYSTSPQETSDCVSAKW